MRDGQVGMGVSCATDRRWTGISGVSWEMIGDGQADVGLVGSQIGDEQAGMG